MKRFSFALVIGAVLGLVPLFLLKWFGVDFETSNLEVLAVATSYACTWLCVQQSRWNYPVGMISTAMYSYLLWQWGMPALSIFNLYLVFSLAYGMWRWGPDDNSIPVTRVDSVLSAVGYALFGAGLLILFMSIVAVAPVLGIPDVPVNRMDIAAAIASGIAQLLLDNKKIETWCVWAVVNVISIVMFWQSGLYLPLIQYLFFLGNTVYGFVSWQKTMKPVNLERKTDIEEFLEFKRKVML